MASNSQMPHHGNNDTSDRQARRQIYEMWEMCRTVRQRFWEEFQAGGVSEETRKQFQTVVMTYYDELRKYRNEAHIRDDWESGGPWDDGGLDKLQEVAMSRDVRTVDGGGRRGKTSEERAEPTRIPPQTLYKVSHDLDDIAVQLDFGVDIEPPEAMTDPI